MSMPQPHARRLHTTRSPPVSQDKKEAAYKAIQDMEDEALVNMQLMPGARELCRMLDQAGRCLFGAATRPVGVGGAPLSACCAPCERAGIPRGLITRNVLRSVDHFHNSHLVPSGVHPFAPAISRECSFAYKPSPEVRVGWGGQGKHDHPCPWALMLPGPDGSLRGW